ncbi:hypothetical protein M0R04_10480 [Candidatus Dojkabacteria bacterium]|jgi:hypothetical protein|nr:hypothetical protein [Candidatus Dojkabacteria bacterium]
MQDFRPTTTKIKCKYPFIFAKQKKEVKKHEPVLTDKEIDIIRKQFKITPKVKDDTKGYSKLTSKKIFR